MSNKAATIVRAVFSLLMGLATLVGYMVTSDKGKWAVNICLLLMSYWWSWLFGGQVGELVFLIENESESEESDED